MNKFLAISVLSLFAFVGAFTVTSLNTNLVSAHDGEDHGEEVAQTDETEQTKSTSAEAYEFTAQPGDSFTKLVRKAVQIYGIDNDVDLNQAEIIAAETFLTIDSGSPSVNAGEKVIIPKSSVKTAADKAEGLDKESEQRWERYVPYVDFNTDKVGQSS